MRKLQITCFLLFLKLSVLSQGLKNIYIEPLVSWKIHATRSKSFSSLPASLPYLNIEPERFIFPDKFYDVYPGINLGYCFKTNDKLQAGISLDKVSTGFTGEAMALADNGGQQWLIQQFTQRASQSLMHFSLIYKRNLLVLSSKQTSVSKCFINTHLNFGLSVLYYPKGATTYKNVEFTFLAPDSSNYLVTTAQRHGSYRNFKLNCGLDITIGKGNREWFTLNLAAMFGYNDDRVNLIRTQIIVTKNNQAPVTYRRSDFASDNGFYLTISRRIFPFRSHKGTGIEATEP